MKKTLLAALVAAGQLLLAKPATAVTFNFSWRSDALGLTYNRGGPGGTYSITGTIDINVMPGADFTKSDITAVDITMRNDDTTFCILIT